MEKRLDVLEKTEQKLSVVEDFNNRLQGFDAGVTELEDYLVDARHHIDDLIKPSTEVSFSPEDRVTRWKIVRNIHAQFHNVSFPLPLPSSSTEL